MIGEPLAGMPCLVNHLELLKEGLWDWMPRTIDGDAGEAVMDSLGDIAPSLHGSAEKTGTGAGHCPPHRPRGCHADKCSAMSKASSSAWEALRRGSQFVL